MGQTTASPDPILLGQPALRRKANVMHPLLSTTMTRFEEHFLADNRCLGMYLWGSAGQGTADEFSDVDIGIVVQDEAFAAIKEELRPVCERLCGTIRAWLPEGEREQFGNYAFLFDAGSELLLYDFTVMSRSFCEHHWGRHRPIRILFDREGVLAEKEATAIQPYSPDRLLTTITDYWVYAYLNGKYFKRADVNKLLYIQSCLFQIHVRLLHALHPDADWSWWPISLKQRPKERQARMRIYFGSREVEEIAQALGGEIRLFSEDAREACRKWSVEYPRPLEQSVRSHLQRMGLPIRE